jgi:DNA repair protein RecO (recombination protein O)
MILKNSEAIVLRTHKLAEADKIVIFLSRSGGLVRGVARGARRLKSRFGAGLEPFTEVVISWVEKEERELAAVRQVEIRKSYFKLSGSPELVSVLERMCAHALYFAQPHQPDERLYRMVSACFEALHRRPVTAAAVLTYFELWLLKLSGFLPDLSACGGCGRGLESAAARVGGGPDGVLFCSICASDNANKLEVETVNCLIRFRVESPQKWSDRFQQQSEMIQRQTAAFSDLLVSRTVGLPREKTRLPGREYAQFARGLRENVFG